MSKLKKLGLVVVGLVVVGLIFGRPLLKFLTIQTAEQIVAPQVSEYTYEPLTLEELQQNVPGADEEFFQAYKAFLDDREFSDTTLEMLQNVANREMTEENCYVILLSKLLIAMGHFYSLNIHDAYLAAKDALATAKKVKSIDVAKVNKTTELVARIEKGEVGVKDLPGAISNIIGGIPKEGKAAIEELALQTTDEDCLTGLIGAIKAQEGLYGEEKIEKLQKVVEGDFDALQKADAQFQIARTLQMRYSLSNTLPEHLEEVVAAYQKVIDNYTDTEYATQAIEEIANLYATHSTAEHRRKAIEYYQLLLSRIDPYSGQAEEIIKKIEALEREAQELEGKIIEGVKLPELKETKRAQQILEDRKINFLKTATLKDLKNLKAKIDQLPTTQAKIKRINELLISEISDDNKADFLLQKAKIYQESGELQKALSCYLRIIEDYPTAPAYVDASEIVRELAATQAVKEMISTYEEGEKGLRLILKIREKNPDKYLFDLAKEYEQMEDWTEALKCYKEICQKYPDSGLFNSAKEKVVSIYINVYRRPDKAKAWLDSLSGGDWTQKLLGIKGIGEATVRKIKAKYKSEEEFIQSLKDGTTGLWKNQVEALKKYYNIQ